MVFLRKHKEYIIVTIILLIAAFLRLYRIADFLTFLGDEGRDALAVYDILHGHLTLLGPRASAGDFFTGPIYYYMMAPFLLLFDYNPVGPAVMIALLSVATVLLIYFIGKKMFGTFAGIIASALYAISPLVIVYSRSSWNPNPMPFFTLLLLYLLYLAIKKQSTKLLIITGILYGVTIQLHYIEVVTGAIIFLFVIFGNALQKKYFFYKKNHLPNNPTNLMTIIRASLKQYVHIGIGFIIGFSPFIAFELRHQFENTKAILHFILFGDHSGQSFAFWQIIPSVFSQVFGYLVFAYPSPDKTHLFSNTLLMLWIVVIAIVSLVAISYLRFIEDKLFLLLLLLWLFLGIGLFGFYHKPIYDYYYEFMFPLPFLIFGNFLSRLFFTKKAKLFGKLVVVVFLFVILGYMLYVTPAKEPPNRQMDQMKYVADFIYRQADNKPFNFAMIATGDSPQAYQYFFHVEHHDPVMIQNLLDDPARKSVTSQLFVVCETLPCQPVADPDFPIAGFGQAQVEGQWKVLVVMVYKLVHYSPSIKK